MEFCLFAFYTAISQYGRVTIHIKGEHMKKKELIAAISDKSGMAKNTTSQPLGLIPILNNSRS